MKIAIIGHKRIPSREGGVEVVVEELATRLVENGHQVDVYNRKGKNVQDKNADKEYVCEIIEKTLEKMKIRIDKFRNHKPNKVQMSIIEDMVKEVI